MPRQPKNKAAEPPKPVVAAPPPVAAAPAKAPPVIDVDNFIRVRDSVYQRLSTIQDLIKSFSQDYLRQTNLLLGEGTNLEGLDLDQQFGFGQLAQFTAGVQTAPVEEKKERKKRTHDPNAPKRPLTPYFLYMQTARPIIANDLGEDAPKGAVQEEGQRRWSVMNATEKAGWNTAYQYNLRLYNARVQSYKAGNLDAKNMSDADALKYADEHNVPMPSSKDIVEDAVGNDQDAIAQQLSATAPVEEASEEEPAPTTKTPKGKQTRKPRKTATPATEPEPAKVAATPASPEQKKRKRTSKAAELAEEPKKSARKKTKSG